MNVSTGFQEVHEMNLYLLNEDYDISYCTRVGPLLDMHIRNIL